MKVIGEGDSKGPVQSPEITVKVAQEMFLLPSIVPTSGMGI